MTCKEFSEWRVFDSLDPIGDQRDDFRIGQLISILVNALGLSKNPTVAHDFMPFLSDQELQAIKDFKKKTHEERELVKAKKRRRDHIAYQEQVKNARIK